MSQVAIMEQMGMHVGEENGVGIWIVDKMGK